MFNYLEGQKVTAEDDEHDAGETEQPENIYAKVANAANLVRVAIAALPVQYKAVVNGDYPGTVLR